MKTFKHTILIWFVAMITHSTFAQSDTTLRISGEYQRKALKEILQEIEKQHDINFYYIDQQVENVEVTAVFQQTPLQKALKTMLDGTKLTYKINPDGSIVIHEIPDQGKGKKPKNYHRLEGKIHDKSTDEPMPYVNVYIPQISKGTVTDENGYYKLDHLAEGEYFVHYSFVGYQGEVEKIDLDANLDVSLALEQHLMELKEVEITPGVYEIKTAEITPMNLSHKEILHSPNFAKDISRTIRALPGIANNDFTAKPRIRGGNALETAVYMDNFEIYEPYHLEEADGVFSIFNTDYVNNVKILSGGFSAKYTDKLSGIMRLQSPDYIDKDEYTFSIDMINAMAFIKKKIGKKANLFFSARRGFVDFLVGRGRKVGLESVIDPDENNSTDIETSANFFDIWTKFNYKINLKNQLSVNAIFARNHVEISDWESDYSAYRFDNTRNNFYAWMNWKYMPGSRFFMISTAGYQKLFRKAEFDFQNSITENNLDKRVADVFIFTQNSIWNMLENHHIEFGIEFKKHITEYDFQEIRYDQYNSTIDSIITDTIDVYSKPGSTSLAGYAQYIWNITPKLEVLAGVRASYFSFIDGVNVTPRIAIGYSFSDHLTAKIGYGIYYQPDDIQKLKSFDGQAYPHDEIQKSMHYTGSVNFVRKNTNILFNAYYKQYEKLFDDYRYDIFTRMDFFSLKDQEYVTHSGRSYGIELIFRHKYGNGNLLNISYAFGKNKITNGELDDTYRDFDRRHTIIVNNIFSLKRNWSVSVFGMFYTGEPQTPVEVSFVGNTENPGKKVIFYELGEKNSSRYDDYFSLAVKVEKTWYFKRSRLNVYLNIVNITNHTNVRNYYWWPFENSQSEVYAERVTQTFLPRFISPGIGFTF